MTLRVNVTASDIRRGVKSSTFSCPVARAIRRRKGCEGFYVADNAISKGGWDDEISLPAAVTRWIRRFDTGRPVDPITFDIEVTA